MAQGLNKQNLHDPTADELITDCVIYKEGESKQITDLFNKARKRHKEAILWNMKIIFKQEDTPTFSITWLIEIWKKRDQHWIST